AGLVTSGAAAALMLGTAAILAGHDLGRMERLPRTDGFPNEMLVAREHRSGYDHAVRAAGAVLVEVGFNEIVSNAGVRRAEAWEYAAAINPRTCGVLYVHAPDSRPELSEVVEVARRHRLPVLVDAAGELPPRDNLRGLIAAGADLVCFSGGKAIRGPQASGILCGRRELISSAALQMLDMDDHPQLWDPPPELILRERIAGPPRHGIGRALKVGKEEIVALLAALRLFGSGAYEPLRETGLRQLEAIAHAVRDCAVVCRVERPADGERWPLLEIAIAGPSPAALAFDVCRRLRDGTPAVHVGHGKLSSGVLVVNPVCLRDEQLPPLIERLRAELSTAATRSG
ncbi:MAG: DegT/DnrJ/EryC1/StrS family aminotransferase, partial [Pirellulaceae bacterium]|nr:DegT/DnrJ/EryC1/StrS family aminotransferase [Pirellulaceae bacterium]